VRRGAVYLHSNFQFKDSFFGSKYIILLNNPSNSIPPLFVKVTSQQKEKPTEAGCLEQNKLYFLPAKSTCFPLPTWVQLYEIYEMQGIERDPKAKLFGALTESLAGDIVKCLLYSCDDDIMPIHRRYLSPPPKSSPAAQQLAERFNKKRL
jgi:hypothetical protein